jgi:hypothetical protein
MRKPNLTNEQLLQACEAAREVMLKLFQDSPDAVVGEDPTLPIRAMAHVCASALREAFPEPGDALWTWIHIFNHSEPK